MPEEKSEKKEDKKYNTRVTISSLGNERRVINLGECNEEEIQEVIKTVQTAFATVRVGQALMLTGADGVATFANLDNIAFVEVHVG